LSDSLSITYVVPYDPFDPLVKRGAEIGTRDIAVEMAARGHDVTIVHSYAQHAQERFESGVRVCGVPNRPYPYVAGWTANLAVSRFLSDLGSKSRGDIIDVGGGGLGWAFRRVASLWKARAFHVVDLSLNEWRRIPLGTRLRTAPLYFMLDYGDRLCAQTADWIVVETSPLGKELARVYPHASMKWTTLPPPIPRSWTRLKDVSYDPSHFLFIGAGARRDTGLFLQALRLLALRGITVSATILREDRGGFRELAGRLKVDVRFSNPLPEAEMQKALAESCAFVLPSIREAYCRTVVEAAFHGTPSIVSNLLTVREFVIHGRNGVVVDSWDPKSWADTLQHLIRDPQLRNNLGQEARALALQNYSAERIGSLTEQGYRTALDRHGK
jgi:glycosyltransferase involved in cell wall biosynthesis